MSLVESSAVFHARASAFGVSVTDIEVFAAASVDTLAGWAFLVPFNPGAPNDEALNLCLKTMLGRDLSIADSARFRRLQFECHTQMLADTKMRIERTDASEPRRMPAPERASRMKEQRDRISGISIQQENEPSHQLLDAVHQMGEDCSLKYLATAKLTSRMQELCDPKAPAAIQTDLLLRQALLRRALAFDQALIVSYDTMESWHRTLFQCMQNSVPTGYQKVSTEQILRADVEMFIRMSEECTGHLVEKAGVRPLDKIMANLMKDHRINLFLSFHMGERSRRILLPKSKSERTSRPPQARARERLVATSKTPTCRRP
jgi:hypothetical protein